MMIRWNFGVALIILVVSFELLGSAHGRSNRVKNPLLDPSKANGFINSFLRYLIQSGAFAAKQEQDIADVIDTLQQAMSSTQSSKRGSAAKSQAMTLAFASVIADLVVIDDENGQGVSIEQKKSVIKQALEKAFMETQGSIDHSFIHEIENLIRVFEEENAQSYDDNAEDSYQSYDDNSSGFLQPVSDLGEPQIDAGVYGKFNLGAQNLFDSNLNLDVQPAFLTSVSSQNQQGYGIDVSGNIAPNWNMNLNQQAQQGNLGNQNALNIYGLPSINTPQYFTDMLTRKLQATRVFEAIAKTQLSQKDWWFMSESICRNLGNKFRIPINNSIINQLYQTLTKGAQSNELPSLFSAAISSILGKNILQTQGLLNINLDSVISQTIEGILRGLGQALNINIDIKKALDLAAQVKVDAGVGLNANIGAAVGADIGAALGADVGVGLRSDVGLGLDASVGLDANANIDAGANADISTNLGLGFSPSIDAGLGVGFNAPNIGLKFKNLLTLKLKATGVLDILASKKPSKSDIANISKLICRFLGNKFQIQLNASMIKLLYGSLIKLNARARPDDFGKVLAAVIMNILQSQGLLNVNPNSLLTQATECILLGLSQALNINIDIKKALDLASQVKVDTEIDANTDISRNLGADAGVGVSADVAVALGTDVDLGFGADVGTGLDASLGTDAKAKLGVQAGANFDAGANADLRANLDLLKSAGKGLEVGLNVPNFGLKLTNLLALKLKATGVFNVLAKKTLSQSDILNISKLISRLLANKFQIQLNISMIKLFYGSLVKLNGRVKPEDFANVLAATTMNILQSQGLLKINLDSLLTQATECILQGFAKALNINIDIENALDLAAQVQVDIGVGVDADAGVGLGTDTGFDLGTDVGIGLGGDVDVGIGAGIGVGLDTSVGVDTNLGLGLSPSTGIGLQAGLNVPDLSLKLTNLLGLKLKATGVLNILATKTPSRSDIVNISKSISKLLANKFQIQFNGSLIKLFYNSLVKLDTMRKPDDFANVLAAVTMNIFQSQGLLNINLDSLLTQATECILLGLGEALNINIDIKKALDLAAQVTVNVGADAGLAGDVAIGVGTDAGAEVDANTNIGIQAGANIDAGANADINANLGLGLSPSTGVRLGFGMNVPDLGLKLKNLLVLKLKATDVLNILATKAPSRSDILNISKSICRLLANKFQVKLDVSMIKLLYGSLAKLDATAKSDDFANVLATVTMNILQSQGLLNINLDTLLTQATECILLGLGQGLNINIDIKNALDLAANVKVDVGAGVDVDAGVALGADIEAGVGLGADAAVGLDAGVGVDANANLGIQTGAGVDTSANVDDKTNLGIGLKPSPDVRLGVGMNVPDLSLKLKNLLSLKLKATGALNVLQTKRLSKSDIVKISKLICRLLANKFQFQLNISTIKVLYGSLIKLNTKATPDDFANVLATVTINILQSQGLLDINLDTVLTQAIECILLALGKALNINIDIKKALDLAAKVKVDISADVNTDAGVGVDVGLGLGADIGLGVGADTGLGLDANAEVDANANLGVQAGAKVDADVNADVNSDLGLGLSPPTGVGLGVGVNAPGLGLKLRNLLALKLKATGVLNILATKKPSRSDIVNISKSICRLLASKFQIKLNVSMIKLVYGSLAKLDGRAKPDDFANVLAAVTMNILQSQGLLNITLDSLLTQATECILVGLGQALNINFDIQNALDLAAKVKVDTAIGVDTDVGVGLGADVGVAVDLSADAGVGLDASVGVDANTNLGILAGSDIDTRTNADVNANLGVGLSPSADVGLGVGMKVPDIGLKLKNLLALKLKATGVLNILGTEKPSKSDIVNISKLICRLLANKFQIQINVPTIKLLYGSLIKLNARATPDDFANVLATVTINILQSQGLLNINFDTLLTRATECILLGLGQALNINLDIKKALDLAAQVKVNIDADVNADVEVGADIGLGLGADIALGVGADTGVGLDAKAGVDANANLGSQAGAKVDADVSTDINADLDSGLSSSTGQGLGVGVKVPDLSLKLENLLALKLKATGVLNILATKTRSRSDIVNISKSICRLLANKFQIKLDVSMIKLFYGSLAKLNATAKADDFANVLAAVTVNILQSQGLLNINLNSLLTQATECILLGLGQTLNINIDIKNALDLAAKVDAGVDVDASVGVGLGADVEAGLGLGTDIGVGLGVDAEAGVGANAGLGVGTEIDANANLGLQAGANLDANLGLGSSPSADIGIGIGLDVPNLILKLRNILSLKLKATGVLNILASNTPSKSDFVNISKSICRLLANKFQIQLNASMIKLFYGSLIKLNGRAMPDDFANVLAAATINILQSQGLLNINIDSLLTQATECILLGFGQALNISVDIKNALDLAAQVKVDVGAGAEANVGVGADLGTGLDAGVGVDANTNLGVQVGTKVDADADVNTKLDLGVSPSADVLGAGLKVPGLTLKLKNLLALKLKATGVLNILVQNPPSKSDIVNISKLISRLLANRFQIQLTTSMIKQLYGSLTQLNSRAKPDDFANVLSAVTMNIIQSQGLLKISLDSLLTQATECIILGLKQALNINVDIKKALDLAAQVKTDIDVGVDADVGVGTDVGLDLDAGIGVDISAGIDVNAGANVDAGANADVSANLGLDVSPSADVEVAAGLNIPNLGLKLRNILTQKLKATGVLNTLTTKTPSKSDIVNISKLICRLLANKFQIQLNTSMIKLFYGSLTALDARAKPDDFAAVLATVTINILQSQGLLNKNLDLLLTQAIECILLGLKQALNINVDIKTAADLAAQIKLDVGADIDADLGVGLGADIGVGLTTDTGVGIGADLGTDLDAGVGVDASANLGVQAGADVNAEANADVNANIGLSLSPSTNEGLGVGLNIPKLGSKLRNLLALKLKATGVLNILTTNRPSKTDIINISKQISRLLANKFQIQLNASMIKLLYSSLIKLNARPKPDDFGNTLAEGIVSILESQGLLNINLDSLLTAALECILQGLGQALRINIDIKKALDLAAQLRTDVGVGLDADAGIGFGADLGLTTDIGVGSDADVNANLGVQAGANVDVGADINANLGLGLSPSANVGLGAGLNAPNLSLKLRNLLALKLKATGVLNVLATRRLSKSDTVNISKLICSLLAKKFQIQLNASMLKLVYGSLIKLNGRTKPDDFANVLSAVIINILQSQGLLRNNLNSLLVQATECILLGLRRALNINIDIKKALDLSAQVEVDVGVGVDTDVGVGVDTNVGVGLDTNVGVGVDTNVGVGVDTNVGLDLGADVGVGLDTDVGLGTDIGVGAGAGIDANANLGVQAAADISADTGVGINVDSKLLNVNAKVKADVKAEAAEQLADALKSSEEFKLAILMGQEETVLSAIGNVINDIFGRKAGISFLSKFNMSLD